MSGTYFDHTADCDTLIHHLKTQHFSELLAYRLEKKLDFLTSKEYLFRFHSNSKSEMTPIYSGEKLLERLFFVTQIKPEKVEDSSTVDAFDITI